MGVLMFRSWAGATAGLFVGLLGVSRVSAEEIGSTIVPRDNSQPAIVFADVSFSSRTGPGNHWGQAEVAYTGELADSLQSLLYSDFVFSSQNNPAASQLY